MNTPFRETDAKFSPDGRWIAYTSDESGPLEIYVRAFPIGSDRVQVSKGGGTMPAWSADGQEILYRTATAMVSVKLTKTDSGFDTSAPRQLFPLSDAQFLSAYGVSADGQRFLFIRSAGNDRVSVLLNWAAHVGEPERPR